MGVKVADVAQRHSGQDGLLALPEFAGLSQGPRAAVLDHIVAERALTAVALRTRCASLA